jgi:polyferredoxin
MRKKKMKKHYFVLSIIFFVLAYLFSTINNMFIPRPYTTVMPINYEGINLVITIILFCLSIICFLQSIEFKEEKKNGTGKL